MTRRGRGAVIQFYREFLRIGGCRNALVAHLRRAARAAALENNGAPPEFASPEVACLGMHGSLPRVDREGNDGLRASIAKARTRIVAAW